jgi:hypothetical protein
MSAGVTLDQILTSNPDEHWQRERIIDAAVVAAICGEVDLFAASLEKFEFGPEFYPEFFNKVRRIGHVDPAAKDTFGRIWHGMLTDPRRHLAGSAMRQSCEGFEGVMADALRVLMEPPPPSLAFDMLFRGQSAAEYERGLVGFSWTADPVMAECYARSRRYTGPTVVLAATVPHRAIINVAEHVFRLGVTENAEIVCDPRMIHHVMVVDRPPKFTEDQESEWIAKVIPGKSVRLSRLSYLGLSKVRGLS